jgi:hypothetical protein
MNRLLIFNHHCLPFHDRYFAEECIPEFLKIISDAKNNAKIFTILLDESLESSWFEIELAPNYFFREWFNKHAQDKNKKDLIRIFKSMATQSPLFEANDTGGDLELFDVKENTTNKNYSTLRAAHWYNSLLYSFPTQSPWNTSPLDINTETYDSTGKIFEEKKELINIFNMDTWLEIRAELIQNQEENIKSGKELWKQCSKLYPRLKYCGKTPAQLQSWSHSTTVLNQIKNCFHHLNSYADEMSKNNVKGFSCQQLRDIGFQFEVSGESSSVKNDKKKKEQRMFYTANGNKEFFENHAKLAHGFRLHFFPDPQNGIIHIGYIGPHLKL